MKALESLEPRQLLQVSMDGPNVNFKFHRLLKEFLKDSLNEERVLPDIGSCGLHTLNNAFKNAIKSVGWDVAKFLRAAFDLFKNVPARRSQFILYSNIPANQFPMKFCSTRWFQNAAPAECAMKINPFLEIYIKKGEENKTEPTCDSFKIVVENFKDKLLLAKLAFFQWLASTVEPFPTFYQSDLPLAPFLHIDLLTILNEVMSKFIKPEILISKSLTKINVEDKQKLIFSHKFELPASTREAIRNSKDLIATDINLFQDDCRRIFQNFVKKVLKRSPLRFNLNRAILFLDSRIESSRRKKRFTESLNILIDSKWISGIVADKAQKQFEEISMKSNFLDTVNTFDKSKDRLDETLIENLSEESVVTQRMVYDFVNFYERIENIEVSKNLILSCTQKL